MIHMLQHGAREQGVKSGPAGLLHKSPWILPSNRGVCMGAASFQRSSQGHVRKGNLGLQGQWRALTTTPTLTCAFRE